MFSTQYESRVARLLDHAAALERRNDAECSIIGTQKTCGEEVGGRPGWGDGGGEGVQGPEGGHGLMVAFVAGTCRADGAGSVTVSRCRN